jgi:protein SCO1/2
MNQIKNKSFYLGITFIVLFLAALVIVKLNNNFDALEVLSPSDTSLHINGFLLPKTLPLENADFTSTDPSFISTDNFEDQWTLLALGYTQCPDICPTTLLKLNEVINTMPINERPNIAFLSIDITPDNISKLSAYMNYFNETFIGLSATATELDIFFKGLGASYSIKKSASGSLDIEHSSSIYLISPDKEYVANFPYMLTSEQIKDDYLAITRNQ